MKVRNSTIRFISRSFILGTSQSGCPIPFFSTSVAATLQDWEMNAQAILPPQWWWDKTCVEEREETDTVGKKRWKRLQICFELSCICCCTSLFKQNCPDPVSICALYRHSLPGLFLVYCPRALPGSQEKGILAGLHITSHWDSIMSPFLTKSGN